MDILALYDEDATYINAFADYLNKNKSLPFDVYVFTKLNPLIDFMKGKSIAMLIAGRRVVENIEGGDVGKIIILDDGDCVSENDDEYVIYKYDPMDKIVMQLSSMYGYLNNHNTKGYEGMIGVYSPFSIKGKMDFSLGYALGLSKKCRTLYINLEEFSGLNSYLFAEDEKKSLKDLSDLMYEYEHLKNGGFVKVLEDIYRSGDLDVIMPIRYAKDLRSIDSGVWGDVINKYAISHGYKRVVVDFGNMLEDPFYIMEMCKVIYIITPSEAHEKRRMKEFVEYVLGSGNENVLEKVITVKLPEYKKPESIEDFHELEEGDFGQFIRELLDDVS